MNHISNHGLECYHLGMVTDEAEIAAIEEHLLWCHICVNRAEFSFRLMFAGGYNGFSGLK